MYEREAAWLVELSEIDEPRLYLTTQGTFSADVENGHKYATRDEAELARKSLKCGGELSVHEHVWISVEVPPIKVLGNFDVSE